MHATNPFRSRLLLLPPDGTSPCDACLEVAIYHAFGTQQHHHHPSQFPMSNTKHDPHSSDPLLQGNTASLQVAAGRIAGLQASRAGWKAGHPRQSTPHHSRHTRPGRSTREQAAGLAQVHRHGQARQGPAHAEQRLDTASWLGKAELLTRKHFTVQDGRGAGCRTAAWRLAAVLS